MAEYQEVARQFKRMCDSRKWCDSCIINEKRGTITCYRFMMEQPMKAEEIIMQWAKEHPHVTNAEKFKEVFGYDPQLLAIWNNSSHIWFDDEFEEPKDE